MQDFSKLLNKVVIKKAWGYKYHRVQGDGKGMVLFQKALKINKEDLIVAKNILRTINVETREDLFLGLSCITLLSAFEKRRKIFAEYNNDEYLKCISDSKSYMYKGEVNNLIHDAHKKGVDFSFDVQKDSKNIPVTYVTVGGVQFSYHNANTEQSFNLAKLQNWEQLQPQQWNKSISFQNGAKEAFEFAIHLKNTSKLRFINETPREYAYSIRNSYSQKENNGKI